MLYRNKTSSVRGKERVVCSHEAARRQWADMLTSWVDEWLVLLELLFPFLSSPVGLTEL